jgi:hypothetical protein
MHENTLKFAASPGHIDFLVLGKTSLIELESLYGDVPSLDMVWLIV